MTYIERHAAAIKAAAAAIEEYRENFGGIVDKNKIEIEEHYLNYLLNTYADLKELTENLINHLIASTSIEDHTGARCAEYMLKALVDELDKED